MAVELGFEGTGRAFNKDFRAEYAYNIDPAYLKILDIYCAKWGISMIHLLAFREDTADSEVLLSAPSEEGAKPREDVVSGCTWQLFWNR